MLKVALCQTKGGSGKSTLVECLAMEAAREGRTSILDLDPQETVSKWWRRRGGPDNPMLIVNVNSLTTYAADAERRPNPPDFLIIDTPGNFLGVIREAVDVADVIVVPISPSIKDWEAMDTLESIVARLKRQARTLYVVNRFRANTDTSKEAIIALGLRALVPPERVALRTDYERAGGTGLTATEINREAAAEIAHIWMTIKELANVEEAHRRVRRAG